MCRNGLVDIKVSGRTDGRDFVKYLICEFKIRYDTCCFKVRIKDACAQKLHSQFFCKYRPI